MKKCLIVPTCRPERMHAWRAAWEPFRFWDELIVLESAPRPTFRFRDATHYGFDDIDEDLGEDSWIISKHDSGRRCYGFWKAWQRGAEVIYTLDDDCLPVPGQDFGGEHLASLTSLSRWGEAVPGLRTRGIPYRNLGRGDGADLSCGLWTDNPDLDAIGQLAHGLPSGYRPPEGTRVLPAGQYFPICGMNLAFTRRFAPLAYFGLQGRPWPFNRFDDIWFGVVAKRICDHLGWKVAVGRPWVHHSRASDPFTNLAKEALGVGENERFWEVVDSVRLNGTTPRDCLLEVAEGLKGAQTDYYEQLGSALEIWAGLFGSP